MAGQAALTSHLPKETLKKNQNPRKCQNQFCQNPGKKSKTYSKQVNTES